MRFLPLLLPALLTLSSLATPQSGVVGWGAHRCDSHWNTEAFVGVAAGACETAAFRADGSVAVWGESPSGQCYPIALPPGLAYVQLSFGGYDGWGNYINPAGHVLGLRSDGSLVAWGNNQWGQCNVPSLPSGITFTSASAGRVFSVATKSDGTLAAWGMNDAGQLNVPVPPPGQAFVRTVAGEIHALGLLSNGDVVAWGSNPYGQCNVPALPSGLSYVDIAAGRSFSAALRSDGMVVAWGDNGNGQCIVPGLPTGMRYTRLCAGVSHALALRSDNALIAWGNNYEHECDVPLPPPGISYVQIAAGYRHSAALRSDGHVACWGDNRKFQCNVARLPAGVTYTKFSCASLDESLFQSPAGVSFALALRSDGNVDVWGNFSHAPSLPAALTYVDIAAGWRDALALRSDGMVVAWGNCSDGACNIPTLPSGLRYVGISASGGDHYNSCGFGYEWNLERSFLLRSDGVLIAIGDGGLGQLSLPPGIHYVQIAAAGSQTVARQSDGQLVACGAYPPSIPGLPPGVTWVDISAAGGEYYRSTCIATYPGVSHAVGLRSDGQVVAWGDNLNGQTIVPALPPGLVYVQVASRSQFSLARRSDGSAVGWGANWQHNCDVPMLPIGEVYDDIACGTFGCIARYASAPACGAIARTCTPSRPNSVSAAGATLDVSGCAGTSANDLVLNVSGLPASTIGMFLYGSQQQQTSFGNGWSCLAGSVQRVLPTVASSPSGAVSFSVDLMQYPFSGSSNSIGPSSGWFFQYLYRDPAGSPTTFNTSDALHMFFAP